MTGAQILIEQGEAKGRAEGEAKGRAEGEAKGRAEALLTLLQAKFGPVPAPMTERVRNATVEQLDSWTRRVLQATSLEDVFSR